MRLIFLRHAKAEDWNERGDHARRLAETGREQAREVGEALRRLGVDRAYVSTAARTRETFDQLGLDCGVRYLDELYDAGHETLTDLLTLAAGETPAPETLLVVGHVPSVQVWAAEFAIAVGDSAAAEEISRWYPTAAFTAIDLPSASIDDLLAGHLPAGSSVLQLVRR